jgi:hypothetical protein
MSCRVSHTTFDCLDAFALSKWWKGALAYTNVDGDPNEPGDEECMIVDSAIGHRLLFIEVPNHKVGKNRAHLDLVPTDRQRDAEIDRLTDLGPRKSPTVETPTGQDGSHSPTPKAMSSVSYAAIKSVQQQGG